jgi:N-methylhydantoinase B
VASEVDPVTYEVVRHRLWTDNLAQGHIITRIAVSPVLQAYDFNMCVLTEDAELVMNGPFTPILTVGGALLTKYVIENLGQDLGIHEGDIFASNDPWIGSIHQMDLGLVAPVFVEGRLFAWVTNSGHQMDFGGSAPGGFLPDSRDIYNDPVILPPFKLVDRGDMRPDLERLYLRQSRMPDVATLDLRAQLAGIHFGVERLLAACEQFGAPTVKAVMRRILDVAQESIRAKLLRIPDGTWSQVRYCDQRMPGDRSTLRLQVNLHKRGDRLAVDNLGSDPQAEGPNGFPYTGFAGGVMGVLSVTMLHEQLFAIGGAERQVDFEPVPGLLSCADHPAAVSGGILNQAAFVKALMAAFMRMLSCDPESKYEVLAPESDSAVPMVSGIDQYGRAFGVAVTDGQAVGSGARAFKDGLDSGGITIAMMIKLNNVEVLEQFYPIVYLYRRKVADSGGAGRWRGGAGMRSAITPIDGVDLYVSTFAGGSCVSTHGSPGVAGGYPSATCQFLALHGTDVLDRIRASEVPTRAAALRVVSSQLLQPKSVGTHLVPGDVLEVRYSGGGGYGDPLDREPERVAADVLSGSVTCSSASLIYGVEIKPDGTVNVEATKRRRYELREERKRWVGQQIGPPEHIKPMARGDVLVHEYVALRTAPTGAATLVCRCCDRVLGGSDRSYKAGLLIDVSPVTSLPLVEDPARFIDDAMVVRRYACPGCGVLMATEIAPESEGLWDEVLLVS